SPSWQRRRVGGVARNLSIPPNSTSLVPLVIPHREVAPSGSRARSPRVPLPRKVYRWTEASGARNLDLVRKRDIRTARPALDAIEPHAPELLAVGEPGPLPNRRRPGLDLRLDHRPELLPVRVSQEWDIQPRSRELHLQVRHRHLHLADVRAERLDLALDAIADVDRLVRVAGRLREEVALAYVMRLQALIPVLRMVQREVREHRRLRRHPGHRAVVL